MVKVKYDNMYILSTRPVYEKKIQQAHIILKKYRQVKFSKFVFTSNITIDSYYKRYSIT